MRMRHKDGRWIWVLDRGKVVERDDAGRPTRIVGTKMNITARKNAELALRQTGELLAQTGRLAKIGGWEIDVAGRTVTWDRGDLSHPRPEPGGEAEPRAGRRLLPARIEAKARGRDPAGDRGCDAVGPGADPPDGARPDRVDPHVVFGRGRGRQGRAPHGYRAGHHQTQARRDAARGERTPAAADHRQPAGRDRAHRHERALYLRQQHGAARVRPRGGGHRRPDHAGDARGRPAEGIRLDRTACREGARRRARRVRGLRGRARPAVLLSDPLRARHRRAGPDRRVLRDDVRHHGAQAGRDASRRERGTTPRHHRQHPRPDLGAGHARSLPLRQRDLSQLARDRPRVGGRQAGRRGGRRGVLRGSSRLHRPRLSRREGLVRAEPHAARRRALPPDDLRAALRPWPGRRPASMPSRATSPS